MDEELRRGTLARAAHAGWPGTLDPTFPVLVSLFSESSAAKSCAVSFDRSSLNVLRLSYPACQKPIIRGKPSGVGHLKAFPKGAPNRSGVHYRSSVSVSSIDISVNLQRWGCVVHKDALPFRFRLSYPWYSAKGILCAQRHSAQVGKNGPRVPWICLSGEPNRIQWQAFAETCTWEQERAA